MSKSPRTDAVFKAFCDLGPGSFVPVPKGYPPCDPWALARQLETELTDTQAKLARALDAIGTARHYLKAAMPEGANAHLRDFIASLEEGSEAGGEG